MLTQIPDYQGSYKKKVWLASSINPFRFKDEAKQTMSSFLQNTLSNYFEVESPDDQVYSKQTRSIKQRKNKKENKNSYFGNRETYPRQRRQRCCHLIHTYKRGEVSNPLGVSLEAQT
jgi:hypothetical protein